MRLLNISQGFQCYAFSLNLPKITDGDKNFIKSKLLLHHIKSFSYVAITV